MRKVLQLLSVVVVGIAVALMLISPELVLIFGSPKYSEAVYVIPPVAASVFFIFIYNILSMPQFYYEKTQFLMAASMAAAGANVVLNFIFIRLYGKIRLQMILAPIRKTEHARRNPGFIRFS